MAQGHRLRKNKMLPEQRPEWQTCMILSSNNDSTSVARERFRSSPCPRRPYSPCLPFCGRRREKEREAPRLIGQSAADTLLSRVSMYRGHRHMFLSRLITQVLQYAETTGTTSRFHVFRGDKHGPDSTDQSHILLSRPSSCGLAPVVVRNRPSHTKKHASTAFPGERNRGAGATDVLHAHQ